MRISTLQIFDNATQGFQEQQINIARLQAQLASGKRNTRPSDNPSEFSRVLQLRQNIEQTTQYIRNSDAAEARLNQEESTLTGIHNILQRTRELSLQAASTIISQEARDAIAIEVRERLSELLSLGNTIDAYGDYLFAGSKGNTLPFVSSDVEGYQVVDFVGDQVSRRVQISLSDQIETSDSGSDVLIKIPSDYAVHGIAELGNTGTTKIAPVFRSESDVVSGDNYRIEFTAADRYDIINTSNNTTVRTDVPYVNGQSIEFDGLRTTIEGTPDAGDAFEIRDGQYQDLFTTFNKLILNLERGTDNAFDRNNFSDSINESLEDIDQALDHINNFRAKVGGRANIIEASRNQNDTYLIDTQQAIGLLEDLDYARAASELQQSLLSLQAAQQAFSRTQSNNLFSFL